MRTHLPQRARFMAGLVTWRAGELCSEIDLGAWYVLEPDAALVMRPPEGLMGGACAARSAPTKHDLT